jgi:hypothetical protein
MHRIDQPLMEHASPAQLAALRSDLAAARADLGDIRLRLGSLAGHASGFRCDMSVLQTGLAMTHKKLATHEARLVRIEQGLQRTG